MSKLTTAQASLLKECADDGRGMTAVSCNYAPAKIMVARGLAAWLRDDPYSERLIITEAGRAALSTGGKAP